MALILEEGELTWHEPTEPKAISEPTQLPDTQDCTTGALWNRIERKNKRSEDKTSEEDMSDFSDKPDMINHPPHYTGHPSGVEAISITEHMNYCLGNAMKYIWRADLKGTDLDDLEKAIWYLNRELSRRLVLGDWRTEIQ